MSPDRGIHIGGMRVDAGNYGDATDRILNWARQREKRYVCVANVHMVMEAYDSASFREVINHADMVTSDGMPLVWVLRKRGYADAERVYGPTLMLHVCEACAAHAIPIAFFGGTPDVLVELKSRLLKKFPELQIAASIAPPFGQLTDAQNSSYLEELARSGAQVLFVGLGCPKQERWMAAMSPRLGVPMLGVGAAFNFHAGRVRQSPAWMQKVGLEWLFRFAMEPRRLWRRYVLLNPRFVWLIVREHFGSRRR